MTDDRGHVRAGRRWPGALLLAVVLCAAACTPGGEPATDDGADSAAPDTYTASFAPAPCPSPNLEGVPQLDLGPEFECGELTVPENRADPQGATITLAVARTKAAASDPRPDPIVYLTGGPGGLGLLMGVQQVAAGWNADRDLILVAQRGTFHADPLLSCPEIDAFFHDSVRMSAEASATREAGTRAVQECRDRLAGQDIDLAAYNTLENAADIADLRVAMGIEEWNLYGVSYGTDLALQVLRDHPEGIRSVVLDSVVPPHVDVVAGFWPNAAAGYAALFEACGQDPACQAAFPDLESEFTDLVNELSAQPRTVTVPDPAGGAPVDVVIDGFTLANLVVTAGLIPGQIAGLPTMIHDLRTGDGTLAAATVLLGRPPSGLTGYGLTYGVFCGESVAATDPETVEEAARAVLPRFPAEALDLVPQLRQVFEDCAAWDVGSVDARVHQPVHSDIPALIVTGALDAITPPHWADEVAAGLTGSHTLRFPGAGHDVMIWSTECGIAVMNSFLNDPGDYDDTCLATVTVPPFTVPVSAG